MIEIKYLQKRSPSELARLFNKLKSNFGLQTQQSYIFDIQNFLDEEANEFHLPARLLHLIHANNRANLDLNELLWIDSQKQLAEVNFNEFDEIGLFEIYPYQEVAECLANNGIDDYPSLKRFINEIDEEENWRKIRFDLFK